MPDRSAFTGHWVLRGSAPSCDWKLGAWRNIVLMQKNLGPGDTQPPLDAPGL